jgi:diketogulonate reductase-like aldo/keto reductase
VGSESKLGETIKIPLNNGSDEISALGFGTLIADPIATKEAVRISLEVGFRQFDCAERYRNEEQVGEAMRAVFEGGQGQTEGRFCRYEALEQQSSSRTS